MFKEDTRKICRKARKDFQENTCLFGIKSAGVRSRIYWWPNLEISGINYLFGMRLKYVPRMEKKNRLGDHNSRRESERKSNRTQRGKMTETNWKLFATPLHIFGIEDRIIK
jgi:hypothetical protein